MADRFAARPRAEDITLFTQELGWMVGAGVPLGRGIDLLVQEGPERMRPVLAGVRNELRSGASFADALGRQMAGGQTVFPEPYLRLVALAEGTGTLPLVLDRLHAGRAQAAALQRRIGSALVYPTFLFVVALGAMAMITLAVVPQMRAVLPPEPRADGADAAIRRLIALSDWAAAHGLVLGVAAAAGLAGLAWAVGRAPVRRAAAQVALHLPVLGPLVAMARIAGMTRSLAMLTEAGLPLAEALRLTRRSLDGDLAQVLAAMEQALRSGEDPTGPLRDVRGMPPLLISLIRVGQETGDMARSLGQAAAVFDEKTRIALDRALVLLEPAIILVISVGVGTLIYTVIGALMSVNDLFV